MVRCPFDQTWLAERQLLLTRMLWRNWYLLVVLSVVLSMMRMLLLLSKLLLLLLLLPPVLILELWLLVRIIPDLWILIDRDVVLKWHCDVPLLCRSDEIPFICICGGSGPDKV